VVAARTTVSAQSFTVDVDDFDADELGLDPEREYD